MRWQTILALLVAVPVLALFGGIGFLAWQVGQTWDARSTDSLISGLVVSCSTGGIFMAILLSLIVGIPLALRAYERGGIARQSWHEPQYRALPPASPRAWTEYPPMIEDKQQGSWHSSSQDYDLWDDTDESEWDRQSVS